MTTTTTDPNPSYIGARPDRLAMLSSDCHRALDIGCAEGALGAALKTRNPSAEVTGIEFDQTVVQLRLLAGEGQALDSRAQARRVGLRLTTFKRATIDFDGVTDVGHGFTDELFRVFAKANPQIELVATNTTPRIEALIKSARAG